MIQGEEDSPTQRQVIVDWESRNKDARVAPEHPVNTEIQITTRRPPKWDIQTATLEGCGGGNVGSK